MKSLPDNSKITLYAYNFRSRAERVIWLLNELALDYKVVRLDPFKGETNTNEFLKLNPNKKIPVLTHKARVYTESLAIMEYLCDIAPSIKLIPDDIEKKYQFRNEIYYLVSEVECYLWIADQAIRLRRLYTWPKGTHFAAIQKAEKNILKVFCTLENNTYIVGSMFTMADIYAYHIITWARAYKIEIPSDVKKYLKHLEKRPAFPPELMVG